METRGTIYVIDQDAEIQKCFVTVAATLKMRVDFFDSAEAYLMRLATNARPGCLMLEMDLPGMSGLELHEQTMQSPHPLPVIFLSASATVPTAVEAMKNGAVSVLEKPCSTEILQNTIRTAVQRDQEQTATWKRLCQLQQYDKQLTDRERVVLEQIVMGKLNKSIATMLTLSQRTIENDRSVIMKKFQVDTAPELAATYTEYRMLSGNRWRIDPAARSTRPRNDSVNDSVSEKHKA